MIYLHTIFIKIQIFLFTTIKPKSENVSFTWPPFRILHST